MNAERYRLYERYMRSCMGDSAHDAEHVYRTLYAALVMARSVPGVDREALIVAALLHDVGRAEQLATGESHALIGARKAQAFLLDNGETEDFVRQVADCIRTHRFRSDDPPVGMEAKLLYDADKLDVCGAVGVARTLMYQGHVGTPLYSVDSYGVLLSGEEKTPSFYSEYRHKLRNIAARFLTAEGRAMAKRRAEHASSFYESLCAEAAVGESGSAWRLLTRSADARQRRVFNLAMMLAGDGERTSASALGEAVMRGGSEEPENAAERAVADAIRLDDLGALGVAQRLIGLGAARRPIDALWEREWTTPAFYTAQARSIAAVREPAAHRLIEAIREELSEYREEGERLLGEYLAAADGAQE